MIEFELEKKYTTQEVADILGISYGTFRNSRKKYEDKLSEGYDGEYNKRRYIFHRKIGEIYGSKSERYYNEIYLPMVIEVINRNPGNTGAGVTNEIGTEDVMNQVQHLMSTAYNYVCQVLGNEYDVTEKRYAACMGKGIYPRFMTDEEIEDGKKLKSDCAKNNGERIMELTEQGVNGIIKTTEYNKSVKNLASGSFLEALGTWIEKYGFIPVMLKHYEKKVIEMKEFDGGE